jgi:hypothetical protein
MRWKLWIVLLAGLYGRLDVMMRRRHAIWTVRDQGLRDNGIERVRVNRREIHLDRD